jgi:serine/threonine protein kinase
VTRPEVLIGGRYRLVERIAEGGMGSVWEAWDERLHRRVALKQLHPQPGLSASDAQLASNRAMREARITARLHHAHAVPVYDVVDHDGSPCLVMQYLPSKSLQKLLVERGSLTVAEVARIGSEVAAALAAAHEAGIVHRDVKPGNVLIDGEGSAKLTDFGISHALGDVTLTSTGMVTGTPAFLAPEVARGIESGFASDVFSLGSTLYAALEGSPPFGPGENPMAVLHRVASGQVIAPRRSGPLTPVLMNMLAVDPAQRPSMADAARALADVHAAVSDPAAIAPTQRMAAPSAYGPPPSTTASLPPVRGFAPPPASPPSPPSRASHGGRNAAIAAVVLLLAAAAILLATQLGGGSGTTAQSSTSTSRSAERSPTSSQAARTSSSAQSSTGQSSAPQSPTDSVKSKSKSETKTKTNGNGNGNGNASSSQLIQAVDDYYGLLPADTDTAWSRLTPAYQAKTGGRAAYDSFWNSFRSVNLSNERVSGGLVLADLRYTADDGTVSTETRSFRLVRDNGILKIADSNLAGG